MDTDASGLIAQAQTPGTTTTNSLRASLSPMTLPIRVDSRTPRERRAGLSCAECRRSKLKCDRAIPCQACQRRGCAAICPDGTMAATKGNKALQNRAQKLEEQVSVMSDKIKELEAALASTTRTQSHSELRSPDNTAPENPDHDLPKRETEENSAGRLGIDKEGFARYYGGSCASEHLIHLLPGTNHQNMHYCPNMQELGLSLEVVQLYDAFPFGLRERPYSKDLLLPYLPPYERAVDAVEYYMRTFGWIIASHDDISTVIDDIYRHSPTTVESVHPHRLALLFGILSLASLHNMNPNLSEINATRYYVLACIWKVEIVR